MKKIDSSQKIDENFMEQPVDLADLNLSRLRLSKKDIETLSSITPDLPICFQEQLLAKLPPTQARKLSRTLSVQNNPSTSMIKISKRSQSGGRGTLTIHNRTERKADEDTNNDLSNYRKGDHTRSESITFQMPMEKSYKSQSMKNSITTNNSKSLCLSQSNDINNEKYKYYSPYLKKFTKENDEKNASSQKTASNINQSNVSSLGLPPSGRISPSIQNCTLTMDDPNTMNATIRRRTSNALRTIRLQPEIEKSSNMCSKTSNQEYCIPLSTQTIKRLQNFDEQVISDQKIRHTRNKSVDACCEQKLSFQQQGRRSLSRPSESIDKDLDKRKLADEILEELQLLSALQKTQNEQCINKKNKKDTYKSTNTNDNLTSPHNFINTKPNKKKICTSYEVPSLDEDNVFYDNKKSFDKILINTDKSKLKTTSRRMDLQHTTIDIDNNSSNSNKKISKLKRPISYPTKEHTLNSVISENTDLTKSTDVNKLSDQASELNKTIKTNTFDNNNFLTKSRESRLLRPKSYPYTKLAAPKEIKTNMDSSSIISTNSEHKTSIKNDKSISSASSSCDLKYMNDKNFKILGKKSKMSSPTGINPYSQQNSASKINTDNSNPVNEKCIGLFKKSNKGLLHVISSKFEKFREAAMNKEKNVMTSYATEKQKNQNPLIKRKSSEYMNINNFKDSEFNIRISMEACDLNKNKKDANKSEKFIRFESIMRTLRESSVPRLLPISKKLTNEFLRNKNSKRAISDEELYKISSKAHLEDEFKHFNNILRNARSTNHINEVQINEQLNWLSSSLSTFKNNVPTTIVSNHQKFIDERTIQDQLVVGPDTRSDCIHNTTDNLNYRNVTNCESSFQKRLQRTSNKEKRNSLLFEFGKLDKIDIKDEKEHNNIILQTTCSNNYKNQHKSLDRITKNFLLNQNKSSRLSSIDNITNSCNNNNGNNLNMTQEVNDKSNHLNVENNNYLSLTTSFEQLNINGSSESHNQDDAASTSTLLSPTDERELYFDNWSLCSEENFISKTEIPSSTISRLSTRSSQQNNIPETCDPNESLIDRIKRRSFYCRFNEKKTKRTSSIVGPNAVREYYRDQQSLKAHQDFSKYHTTEHSQRKQRECENKKHDRSPSPDIIQEFFRPLKLIPIRNELKSPARITTNCHVNTFQTNINIKSPEYTSAVICKPHKSNLHDICINSSSTGLSSRRYSSLLNSNHDYTTSISARRYTSHTPLKNFQYDHNMCIKNCQSNGSGSSYFSTYNPKKSYVSYSNLNGNVINSGGSGTGISHSIVLPSPIDGYATLGRRPSRLYKQHRVMSLLDPTTSSTDYTREIAMSNNRYRHTSSSSIRRPSDI